MNTISNRPYSLNVKCQRQRYQCNNNFTNVEKHKTRQQSFRFVIISFRLWLGYIIFKIVGYNPRSGSTAMVRFCTLFFNTDLTLPNIPKTRQRKIPGSSGAGSGGIAGTVGGQDNHSVGSSSTTTTSGSKKSNQPHHNKKLDSATSSKQQTPLWGLNRYFVMTKWHVLVGCICLAVASYCGYVGYLETRVNTPFDDHKVR